MQPTDSEPPMHRSARSEQRSLEVLGSSNCRLHSAPALASAPHSRVGGALQVGLAAGGWRRRGGRWRGRRVDAVHRHRAVGVGVGGHRRVAGGAGRLPVDLAGAPGRTGRGTGWGGIALCQTQNVPPSSITRQSQLPQSSLSICRINYLVPSAHCME